MGIEVVSYGAVDQLLLQPTLWEQIKQAQKGHESIEGIKRRLDKEEVTGFTIDPAGILWYKGRICVPSDPAMKQLIMKEAHETLYFIHPGGTKMYQDLKKNFWWHGMKREITLFVQNCAICQRIKAEH